MLCSPPERPLKTDPHFLTLPGSGLGFGHWEWVSWWGVQILIWKEWHRVWARSQRSLGQTRRLSQGMSSEAAENCPPSRKATSLQSASLGPRLPPLTTISLAPPLQWPGLRVGVGCGGADRELALGPESEFHFLFVPPFYPLGRLGLSIGLWP